MPSTDADEQSPQYQQVLTDWLRSTGDQVPAAELVTHVERLLAEALRAGEPAARIADILGRWQTEDGTDPARLAPMIANAADVDTAATPAAAPAGAAAASGQVGGWDLDDLTTATVAITNPWLASLPTPPTDEQLDDIEYHVSRALIEGARPEHVAACLASWHASGSTDPGQLTDLINAEPDGLSQQNAERVEPPLPTTATAAPPVADAEGTPRTADEWLATARANP